jgi:hypothetical protein
VALNPCAERHESTALPSKAQRRSAKRLAPRPHSGTAWSRSCMARHLISFARIDGWRPDHLVTCRRTKRQHPERQPCVADQPHCSRTAVQPARSYLNLFHRWRIAS